MKLAACGALLAAGGILFGAPARPLAHFGVAYYPEAWDESNWAADLDLMRELGVDLVRIGEFNWSGFEPRDGEFDFAPYLRFLDLCERKGIQAMMCTPTAAVPRWMFANHPDVRKVREDGSYSPDGVRQSTCFNSPAYRRYCARIVRRMAEAFARHPAVVMWQLDNEQSIWGASGLCVCKNCERAFRAALKARYGTVERLNREQNGVFWSNAYGSFDEVTLPMRWGSRRTWRREYNRFQSDAAISLLLEQKRILAAANPNWIITSNNPGCSGALRYDELFTGLGYVTCDTYLDAGHVAETRRAWGLFKGLSGKQRKFTVGETGAFNSANAKSCSMDALKAWFWEAVMHGAESYVYFRWRESVSGEEDHPAILPWSGRSGRAYEKIRAYRAELDRLPPIATMPFDPPAVAIVHDGASAQFEEARGFDLFEPFHLRLHNAMERFGVQPDMVTLADAMELKPYRLVILPYCEYVSPAVARKLRDYVAGGGILLAMAKLNCVEKDGGAYVKEGYPVGLTDLFGLEIHERRFLWTMGKGPGFGYARQKREDVPLAFPGGLPYTGRDLIEEIVPRDCTVVQPLSETLFKGAPLLTCKKTGKGEAWYLAVTPGDAGARTLCRHFLPKAGLDVSREWPECVLHARRGKYTVVVNTSEEPSVVPAEKGRLLLGAPVPAGEGLLELKPYDVVIYED